MSNVQHRQIVIIGGGPAGYTAAIYAARAMREPLLLSGFEPGGQLTITTDVENYPGFATAIQGPWLMEQMLEQAQNVGAQIETDYVTSVDFVRMPHEHRPFVIKTDSGLTILADAVIVATGAKAKWLDLPQEQRLRGFGLSACATCDGFFYRKKRVIVIGGGNSAIEEALYLSEIADQVTIVHRRDSFRAEKILQDRVFAKRNIKILWNRHPLDYLFDEDPRISLTGVRVQNKETHVLENLSADGVFIAIGHAPETHLFRGQIELKSNGYIAVEPGTSRTSQEGIFAAGDVADDIYRQAVTAAAMGCMAALDADRWLKQRATPDAKA